MVVVVVAVAVAAVAVITVTAKSFVRLRTSHGDPWQPL